MRTALAILIAALFAATSTYASERPADPESALAALRDGNARYQSGATLRRDLLAEARSTAAGQKPFAVIVSCMDSRTSSELIFDQGIGDVFNIRTAGNVVDENVVGGIEFATQVVGAKLVAVIGHSGCGAVVGAINRVELGNLTGLLQQIEPAVAEASKHCENCTAETPGFADQCIEENVRWQISRITEKSPIVRELLEQGRIQIVGGVHDLASGQVRFLTTP